MTPEQIKARFRARETITAWAKKHGYSPHYVCFVLNGQSKAAGAKATKLP